MADESLIDEDYDVKFREDEELEFFTELALHETERWIQAVTKKNFNFPDDIRKSLENGVLLCELANCLIPGAIRRINRLPTPIAGLDNINVFLKACRSHFGLSDSHLFNASDLEDLSQRAIGDSEHLKEEYDNRLRNVAVTVYWLGRYATLNYQGPQLDQSAFSALVHRNSQQPSFVDQGFPSSNPPSSSWDWAHTGPGQGKPPGDSIHIHARDGSVDSFSKESVGRLEAMPPPAMSNGSSYKDLHSMDRSGSFQSTPDPMAGPPSHQRRYSSTDSMDGSLNSSHSRQGSDSTDAAYPTRRMSSQMLRRQSTGGDPLQFIKGKPATDLAELAQAQIRVAAESKKVAIDTASLLDEDDHSNWQANLSTWKNRRKSQSERSYQMKEELEKLQKEKDGGGEKSVPLPTKTYSQIQEERERRKSTGRHFYPIQDDEEDDIFASNKSHGGSKGGRDDVPTMTHKPRAEIAPWARDDNEEEKNNDKDNEEDKGSAESGDEEINNNKENENGFNRENSYSYSSSPFKSSTDSKNSDFKRSDRGEQNELFTSSVSSQQQSAPARTTSSSSSQDILNRNEGVKSVGPRTQGKIGSIMTKFQDSQNSSSAPKQGYNEKIDLKARMKSFQNSNQDNSSPENQNGSRQRGTNNIINSGKYHNNFEQDDNSSTPSPLSHSVRERSKSASSDQGRVKKVEKNIKIRQKPNDDKGFGFILTGGTDQDKPLTVSKVALGSGADICELKMKDEILCINQCDVSDKTSMEVGDLVSRAVVKGLIELTVHRDASQDDFSDDEEMTSSSDEGEEDVSLHEREPPGMMDQQNHGIDMPEPEPMSQVSEEMFQPVYVDRVQSAPMPQPSNLSPANHDQVDGGQDEEDDDDDGGPPAILRKWQRQRQRNEYAFENSPSVDSGSPVYRKISLNAPIPKSDDKLYGDEKSEIVMRFSKPWDQTQEEWTTQQDAERRSEVTDSLNDTAGGQAMFDSRQEEIKRQYEESLKIAEQRVEERSRQEQSLLEPELEKTRILEERRQQRRNRIQESAAAATSSSQQQPVSSSSSSSSVEPAFFSSSVATSHHQPPPPTSSSYYHDKGPVPTTTNPSHISSMSFNIESKENNSLPPSSSFSIPRQPGGDGVIVIDPRNRSGPVQGAPLEFQVKLAPRMFEDPSISRAEEEKERQRRFEEEEKLKKIQEKERELREQEDRLQQEKEKFRREQEEFMERQQKLQQQQQQQQQQAYQQQQQYQQPVPFENDYSRLNQRQNYSPNSSPYPVQPSFSSSSSSQSYIKPTSVVPVQSAPSSSAMSSSTHHPNSYQPNSVKSQALSSSSKPKWPPAPNDQPRGYNPSRSFKPVNNSYTFSPVQPQFTTNSSNSRNSPQQQQDYGRRDRYDAPKGGKFSREDILAMNRKPIQEPATGRVNQFENQSNLPTQTQNRMPPTREPAVKSQYQSNVSNSAPRTKLRDDSEWRDASRYPGQQQQQPARPAASRDNGARRPAYGSAQDHWLVQEAERRRQGVSRPLSNSGPIKPLPDISNRWRGQGQNPDEPPNPEFMPHAIRQTLLQKTAGARGSDGSSHEGDFLPPPQHQQSLQQQEQQHYSQRSVSPRSGGGNVQHHPSQPGQQQPAWQSQSSYSPSDLSNKYNVNPIHQIQQPSPPTLSRAPPPSRVHQDPAPVGRENGLPVNGSQLCSHCNQELGFGAAMVIESLGIFFHLQCFRCCVCHASLGTGVHGADVRVRMNKLHCQNCYSNDEGHRYHQPNYRSQKIWIEI